MNKLTGFVLLTILLTGCGSSGNDDASGTDTFASEAAALLGCASGANAIVGCWVTRQCEKAIFNGNPQGKWDDFVYYFKSDGTIRTVDLQYDNAACSGTPVITLNTEFYDRMMYSQLSGTVTGDGFSGFEIVLAYNPQSAPVSAVYHISDMNDLCFSDNILIGSGYSSFDVIRNPVNIDFNNCLSSLN